MSADHHHGLPEPAPLGRRRDPLAFAAIRTLRLMAVMLAVAIVVFLLAKASPIDPIDAYLGPQIALVGPEQRALIAERWGLDRSLPEQAAAWLGHVANGELGWSFVYNAPVADVVVERFLLSLPLMMSAWLLSGLLGIALGVLAGAFAGSMLDRAVRGWCYLLAATPTFWIAILLLLLFAVSLGWSPVCCAGPPGVPLPEVGLLDRLRHLLLPILALSVLGVASVALPVRARMVEAMRSDFATYAMAQGAGRLEIAWRHGARHALLPGVTVLFANLGELFGGSVLAEQVFAYPGLGRATIEAGIRGDLPLLLAIALFTTLFVSIGNLVADLLHHGIDPRLRDTTLALGARA